MEAVSVNNRLILEAYVSDRSLRANVSNGFAKLDQKIAVKGLRVLIPATLSNGTHVPAGSMAYIREELLHTQPWATKNYECDTIKGKFIIVDQQHIEFISGPELPAA